MLTEHQGHVLTTFVIAITLLIGLLIVGGNAGVESGLHGCPKTLPKCSSNKAYFAGVSGV